MPDIPPTTSEQMMDDDALYANEYGDEDDEADTCEKIVERTGEVCGRERPCPYHDDD